MIEDEKKGLTPAGIAVVVVACVSLIALPLAFIGLRALPTMFPHTVIGPPPIPLRLNVDVELTKSFKRVGKDIHAHIVINNGRSSTQLDTVNLKATMEHKGPEKPIGKIGPIAAHGTKAVDLVFKNLPKKSFVDFEFELTYTYPNGSGSSSESGGTTIP